MKRFIPVLIILLCSSAWAAQQYPATGMVMSVDRPHRSFVVSTQEIPGFMAAMMMMPLEVRQSKELDGLTPGTIVEFTLVVDRQSSYAEHVRIRPYQTAEQDPWKARQLKLLADLTDKSNAQELAIGQQVPDFTLIDQQRQPVSLSQFAGKVVALNFVYTSCALPNFCYRMANNFGVLQRRLKNQMGRNLVLLTVTFDPQRDQPEVLAKYSQQWKADPATWHFLTGAVPDVRRVTSMFGMDSFPDEGLMDHSLHTVVIDRQGKLAANIEGNRFTVEQLADLVKTVLNIKPANDNPVHVMHNGTPKS